MRYKHLAQLFGVVPTTVGEILRDMIPRLLVCLRYNELAQVKFPKTSAEKESLAQLIAQREPSVQNCIGFVDGVSFHRQCSSEDEVQNVFLFDPRGKVRVAMTNYCGSWHDATFSTRLGEAMLKFATGYDVCVDQGFSRSGSMGDVFMGSMSAKARRALAPVCRLQILRLHNIYWSLRQSFEWGMRGLQGTFPRLKSRLCSDEETRGNIIDLCVLLHNFRTEYVGLNEIATVFNPHYEAYVNLNTYDRIARYYDLM